MKKIIGLLIAIIVIGILIFWFRSKEEGSDTSINISDRNFKVEQLDDIYTVFIADTKGHSNTLEKRKGGWYLNDNYLVNDVVINHLIGTFEDIELQFIPPKSAHKKIMEQFAQIALKIELYDEDKNPLKKFYIGGSTSDERGTYFLMDGAEQIYVMEVPSFEGSLRGRFIVDTELWRDKTVFKAKSSEIKRVLVNYPKSKDDSFIIEKSALGHSLAPYHSDQLFPSSDINKDALNQYLESFELLIAEAHENKHPRKDSILTMVPFAEIELQLRDGTSNKIRLFPYNDIYRGEITENVNQAQQGIRRYFIDCSNGDFMLIQHNVFRELLRPYAYFVQ